MNFLKKIYPEKKLPKGTFKPAILGKFQFGADNCRPQERCRSRAVSKTGSAIELSMVMETHGICCHHWPQ